eukprot:TRINITY_DN5050_c0_g1_i6.p1 TRINITY_DN5050_c0_g1~~TRINITY_DN5050_c0_g1_i6.p1  ORF type:complete len:437 (-),score=41.78 TRINITY_DN5050_c0_g1_i6:21-1331(-)
MQASYTTDDIQIDVRFVDQKVALGENFFMSITIHNETNRILPATRLVASSTSGYVRRCGVEVPQIPPYQDSKVRLEVRVNPAVSIDQARITYSYLGVTVTSTLPMMYIFTGKLDTLRPYHPSAPKYNLLLFGISGASKSSFMNSVLTLLSRDFQPIHRVGVGGGTHHNSRQLARVDLQGVPVSLWDTWGLTPYTYHNGDLQLLLDGRLPSGWDMDNVYDQHRNRLEREASSRDSRVQHAVLFFIPQSSLDKRDETDLIKDTFGQVKHLNPLLLLTRTDEIDVNIRRSPNNPSNTITQLKHQASQLLNIPVNRIFTTVNYTTEREKTFAIDRNTYEILHTALNIAEQNYINKYRASSVQSPSLPSQTTTTRSPSPPAQPTITSRITALGSQPKPQPDLSLKPNPKPKFKPDHRPKLEAIVDLMIRDYILYQERQVDI